MSTGDWLLIIVGLIILLCIVYAVVCVLKKLAIGIFQIFSAIFQLLVYIPVFAFPVTIIFGLFWYPTYEEYGIVSVFWLLPYLLVLNSYINWRTKKKAKKTLAFSLPQTGGVDVQSLASWTMRQCNPRLYILYAWRASGVQNGAAKVLQNAVKKGTVQCIGNTFLSVEKLNSLKQDVQQGMEQKLNLDGIAPINEIFDMKLENYSSWFKVAKQHCITYAESLLNDRLNSGKIIKVTDNNETSQLTYFITKEKVESIKADLKHDAANVLDKCFKDTGLISEDNLEQYQTALQQNDNLSSTNISLANHVKELFTSDQFSNGEKIIRKRYYKEYVRTQASEYLQNALQTGKLEKVDLSPIFYIYPKYLKAMYFNWKSSTSITTTEIAKRLQIDNNLSLIQRVIQYLETTFGKWDCTEVKLSAAICYINPQAVWVKWHNTSVVSMENFMNFLRLDPSQYVFRDIINLLRNQLHFKYIDNPSDPIRYFAIKETAIPAHTCNQCHKIFSSVTSYGHEQYCNACLEEIKQDEKEGKTTKKVVTAADVPPSIRAKIEAQEKQQSNIPKVVEKQEKSDELDEYRKLAEDGDAQAQYKLARILLKKSKTGNPHDEETGNAHDEAKVWAIESALQGNPDGQTLLGIILYEDKDYKNAIKFYQKADAQGHPIASIALGTLYREGIGVPKDESKAFLYYKKAAEQGNLVAMRIVGAWYFEGTGVTQSYKKSLNWCLKVAKVDKKISAPAQFCVGTIYEAGLDVPKDLDKALYWYKKAASHGFKDAIDRLREIGYSE